MAESFIRNYSRRLDDDPRRKRTAPVEFTWAARLMHFSVCNKAMRSQHASRSRCNHAAGACRMCGNTDAALQRERWRLGVCRPFVVLACLKVDRYVLPGLTSGPGRLKSGAAM